MRRVKLAKIKINGELKKEVIYPSEWQTQLYETWWKVFGPYRIVKNESEFDEKFMLEFEQEFKSKYGIGLSKVVPDSYKRRLGRNIVANLNVKEDDENYLRLMREALTREYNPFEVPRLFEKFARINTDNEGEILSFCNEYGFLGLHVPNEKEVINIESRSQSNFFNNVITKESLDEFIHEVNEFKRILLYIKDIQEKNIKNLKLRINITDENIRYFEKQYGKYRGEDWDWVIQLAKSNVKDQINKHIGQVVPYLYSGRDGSYLAGYTSLSLLSVMYYQLFLMLTNPQNQKLEECQKCGNLFTQRKAGMRFCPSDNPHKRSSCENSYNSMKTRARKAIKTGQKTVEEVSLSLNRPIEEIESWIEDNNGEKKG